MSDNKPRSNSDDYRLALCRKCDGGIFSGLSGIPVGRLALCSCCESAGYPTLYTGIRKSSHVICMYVQVYCLTCVRHSGDLGEFLAPLWTGSGITQQLTESLLLLPALPYT